MHLKELETLNAGAILQSVVATLELRAINLDC